MMILSRLHYEDHWMRTALALDDELLVKAQAFTQ
jgi:hypothetical protein